MKKYMYLTLALVLTAAMLVGCGCTNDKPMDTSAPTVLPTNEEVWDSSKPSTRPSSESTMPSTAGTTPTETTDRGNGPLEDGIGGSTGSTEGTGTSENTNSTEGNARSAVRDRM